MVEPMSPREVFLALVEGVSAGRWDELPELYAEQTDVVHPFDPLRGPVLRTREELRAHFRLGASVVPKLDRHPANVVVHETADPEVIVAEFAYEGTVNGVPFALPCIFVLRVRDGQIVESRDYVDHVRGAQVRGRLPELLAALKDSLRA